MHPAPRTSRLTLLAAAALAVVAGGAAVWLAASGRVPWSTRARDAGVASPGAIVSEASAAGLPEAGQPAPDFVLTDLQGRTVRLADLRGKAVLINFWATWCPPCREEMPRIEAFYTRYREQMEVLGVAVGESPEQVRAFLAQHPYSWRFAADPSMSVADRYRVFAIPTSYFIDARGVVRGSFMGAMSAEQLRAFARQAGVDVD